MGLLVIAAVHDLATDDGVRTSARFSPSRSAWATSTGPKAGAVVDVTTHIMVHNVFIQSQLCGPFFSAQPRG